MNMDEHGWKWTIEIDDLPWFTVPILQMVIFYSKLLVYQSITLESITLARRLAPRNVIFSSAHFINCPGRESLELFSLKLFTCPDRKALRWIHPFPKIPKKLDVGHGDRFPEKMVGHKQIKVLSIYPILSPYPTSKIIQIFPMISSTDQRWPTMTNAATSLQKVFARASMSNSSLKRCTALAQRSLTLISISQSQSVLSALFGEIHQK